MRVEPFPLLGTARRASLKAVLLARLENWRHQWFESNQVVEVMSIDLIREVRATGDRADDFDHGSVALERWSDRTVLAAALLGAGSSEFESGVEHSLADALVKDALADLLKVVRGRDDDTAEIADDSVPVAALSLREGSGVASTCLKCRCRVAGVALGMTLPAMLFAEQFSSVLADALPESAQSVTSALDQQRVVATVSLGEAEVTLGDLARLAVGDVIRLDIPLDTEVGMMVGEAGHRFHGRIGRQEQQFAIQITQVKG